VLDTQNDSLTINMLGAEGKIILKWMLRKGVGGCELDSSGSD